MIEKKGVTRPHRAPVAQNAIQGPENPKSVMSRYVSLGACAMTTIFLDNKIFTSNLLSWRFPRKIAFWTISLSAPLPTPPEKRKFYFYCRLAFSETWRCLKKPDVLLVPDLAAPILWAPGNFRFFLLEKSPMPIKFLVVGGEEGWKGGGGVEVPNFCFHGRWDFSEQGYLKLRGPNWGLFFVPASRRLTAINGH